MASSLMPPPPHPHSFEDNFGIYFDTKSRTNQKRRIPKSTDFQLWKDINYKVSLKKVHKTLDRALRQFRLKSRNKFMSQKVRTSSGGLIKGRIMLHPKSKIPNSMFVDL